MTETIRFGVIAPEIFTSISGLERLQRMIDGSLPQPPIGQSANLRFETAAEGEVVLSGTPGPEHLNFFGTVHGGWTATLIDSSLGAAVASTLAVGEGFTTIEFKLNFLKPILSGQSYRCTGKALRRGRTTAISTAEMIDAEGALVCFALGTCAILRG